MKKTKKESKDSEHNFVKKISGLEENIKKLNEFKNAKLARIKT